MNPQELNRIKQFSKQGYLVGEFESLGFLGINNIYLFHMGYQLILETFNLSLLADIGNLTVHAHFHLK